jgi:plasmid stabilization system protein ParE
MSRAAKVDFHPDAAAEFDAATDWYRENSEQAAENFVSEVDRAIARIAQNPSIWADYLRGTRRCLLRRFPYAVVYILHEGRIKVIAVAHGRRRPGYWKKRLNAY